MKKLLIITIIIVVLVIIHSIVAFDNSVTIETRDYSQYDGNIIIGEFYYEKPVVSDKFSGADIINKYFEDSCNEFFTEGSGMFSDKAFERMNGYLQHAKKNFPSDLKKSPYKYYVKTTCTYKSSEYISFRLIYVWSASGVMDIIPKGVTFNLKTGELVSFYDFLDISEEELKERLKQDFSILFEDIKNPLLSSQNDEIFAKDNSVPYSVISYGENKPFGKNFYHDGKNIYITTETLFTYHRGFVYKWSLKDINENGIYVFNYEDEKLNIKKFKE